MSRARKAKRISFVTADEIGILAKVSGSIAGAKVSINALSACSMEGKGYFILLTESNTETKRVLRKVGW
jgi:hypothetical protein